MVEVVNNKVMDGALNGLVKALQGTSNIQINFIRYVYNY